MTQVKAYKRTQQRLSTHAAIVEAGRPLSPQEILCIARQKVPTLGIATIYRHLKALLADGVIKQVTLPHEDFTRYELTDRATVHHHHFLCTQCERAFDIHGCAGDLHHMLPEGFRMHSHDIIIYGVCKECQQQEHKKIYLYE